MQVTFLNSKAFTVFQPNQLSLSFNLKHKTRGEADSQQHDCVQCQLSGAPVSDYLLQLLNIFLV